MVEAIRFKFASVAIGNRIDLACEPPNEDLVQLIGLTLFEQYTTSLVRRRRREKESPVPFSLPCWATNGGAGYRRLLSSQGDREAKNSVANAF